MRFLTVNEFQNLKVYELDDITYRRIERAFIKVLGYQIGKLILTKYMNKTIAQLSAQSWVDIMSELTIL